MDKGLDDEEMDRIHKELGGDTATQRDHLTKSEEELLANIDKALDEDDQSESA